MKKVKKCKECPLLDTRLSEEDIELIIKKAKQIDEKPLRLRAEFIQKAKILGIKDIKNPRRNMET